MRYIYCFIIVVVCVSGVFISSGYAEEDSQRVISLAPAITEIVFALNAEPLLVGVTEFCDYPPAAQNIEKIGGYITPNIEKIVALKPTLVIIAPNSATKAVQAKIANFGINTLVVDFYSLDGLRNTYHILGNTLNRRADADRLLEELNRSIAARQEDNKNETKKKILFVRSHIPLYVAGKGSFEDDIINVVGAKNAITDSSIRYPQFNIEEIVRVNPDIIVDATYYDTPTTEQLAAIQSFWRSLEILSAVKKGNLFIIKTDIHSVPGPRTPLFINILASLIEADQPNIDNKYVEKIIV